MTVSRSAWRGRDSDIGCGCGRRRAVAASGGQRTYEGYYVILRDGTEVPKVSAGEPPFLSAVEARMVVRRAGGGTMRTVRVPRR